MSEMIERVARAIFEERKRQHGGGTPWQYQGGIQDLYREQARVAITAMREPTDSMNDAGKCDGDCPFPGEVWEAMIDAALK